MKINFFTQNFNLVLKDKKILIKWIRQVVKKEKEALHEVSYIFCDDEYLASLNKNFLRHNTLTDIITFDYTAKGKSESAASEIYISIERVKENAIKYKVSFYSELHRVMIHGILHLCGYRDKTKREKEAMRAKEDESLVVLNKYLKTD